MESGSYRLPQSGWQGLRRQLDRRMRWLAPLCAIGLLTPLMADWLAGFGGTAEWLFDLASHWQWLYLAGMALLIPLIADRRFVFLLLLAPLPWLTASGPAPGFESAQPPNSHPLTVVSANVHLGNADPSPLLRWLVTAQPDVVVLNEVSPGYAKKLQASAGFAYCHFTPRTDPFGLAILSRLPITQLRVGPDAQGIGHLDALLVWNGQPIRLTAWHPMPPISPADHLARNLQLQALAQAARASGLPAIVAGDLNATPWSNAFSELDRAGLRRASGLAPTWPTAGQGWFGIPIDHVLVTPHWQVLDREAGPDIGSDHLPVRVRIALRPTTATP